MKHEKYPHFDPGKYDLNIKISSVKAGKHCKHNINYHLVWIPKYRKKVLKGKVKEVLQEILIGQCLDLGIEPLALEIMPDHLHLFVSAKPTHKPSLIVKHLKGNSSRQLRLCFKGLKRLDYPEEWKHFKNLWARGYYCGSAGHVSQDAVKRYILEQQGKDIFEYNVFNSPDKQSKIGDFTR